MKILRKGQFILNKEKTKQDDISILTIYVPNSRAPTIIKETLLKVNSHIKPYTLIVGNFNTPFYGQVIKIEIIQRNNKTN